MVTIMIPARQKNQQKVKLTEIMQVWVAVSLLLLAVVPQKSSAWQSSSSSPLLLLSSTGRVHHQDHHRRDRYFSLRETHLLSLSEDDESEQNVDTLPGHLKSASEPEPAAALAPESPPPPPTPPPPSINDMMLAMNTNPRRLAIGTLSATGIALAGNFLGVTSQILTFFPEEQVESIGIDTYFPRGDYKRCRTKDYTFQVPKEWVADTFVELAKAQRLVQPLDYSMRPSPSMSTSSSTVGAVGRRSLPKTLPDSAYGPPGRLNSRGVSETGDTNVSVIIAPGVLMNGGRNSGNDRNSDGNKNKSIVDVLGPPQQAAENLLSTSIAPEGSGRKATLIESSIIERNDVPYYRIEYVVDRGSSGPPLQNIAVICGGGDNVYTLTVVAPVSSWSDPTKNVQLRKIADSFHLRSAASSSSNWLSTL